MNEIKKKKKEEPNERTKWDWTVETHDQYDLWLYDETIEKREPLESPAIVKRKPVMNKTKRKCDESE